MSAQSVRPNSEASAVASKLYAVMRAVESVFGVPTHRLLGTERVREVAEARHAVFYIALAGLEIREDDVATCLNRDRTMSHHSRRAAADLIASYPEYAEKVREAARIANVDLPADCHGSEPAENANEGAPRRAPEERDGGRDRTFRLRLARSKRVRGGKTWLAMKPKETK